MDIVRKSAVYPLATILFFTYYFFLRKGWPTTLVFSMILYGTKGNFVKHFKFLQAVIFKRRSYNYISGASSWKLSK